jgi:membrane fusion protein, heavy metal efflux system
MTDSNPDVVPLVPTAPTPPKRGPAVAAVLYLLGTIPTLVVLAGVGAVGWYGHAHEWKLPKFSELRGEIAEPDDWCKDHNVPESICVECQPDLMPRPARVPACGPHILPDCVLCNPSLAQLPATPILTSADHERAAKSLAFLSRPASIPNCKTHHRRLQFASDADAEKTGIEVSAVGTGPVTEGVSAAGELGYDQTRVAHLSARSPGTVWKVFKRLGQSARAGEVLALIDAGEVGKAKAEILSAFGTVQLRQQALAALKESGVTAPARVREAEGVVREAEIRLAAGAQALTNLGLPFDESATVGQTAEQVKAKLLLLGIPADVAATIDRRTASANLLPLIAPMDGLIVSRDVVAGEVVDLTKILFELVDTRNLWLTLDVKGEDAARVAVGQKVRFTPDHGGAAVEAVINWRSSQVDPRTRTVKVRADVPDPDGKLLANTFGTGFVVLREEKAVLAVPSDAVHWEGCCFVVFVRDKTYEDKDAPKVFHVRKVRLGARDAVPLNTGGAQLVTGTEIAAGLLPGEQVVVKGGGALLGELLRADLGDGCCGQQKD